MLCVQEDLRRDTSVPLWSRGTTSLVIEGLLLISSNFSTSSLKLTLLCLLESLRIPFGGSASNVSPSEPWIWIWTWFLQEHGKWNRRGKYKKSALPWHLQVGHIGLVWVQGNAISDYDYHHLSSQLPLLSRRLRWKERADIGTAPTSCFTSQPLKIFLLRTGWKLQRFHLFQLPDNARR